MGLADVRKLFGDQCIHTCAAPDLGGTCRRKIIAGKHIETGHNIPLDPSAPIYVIKQIDGQLLVAPIVQPVEDQSLIMVTHFATCRDADLFSRKGRRGL